MIVAAALDRQETDGDAHIEAFMAEAARIGAADGRLSPLGAGMLAALALDIAQDTRSFARLLGVEHALALREAQLLVEMERLRITRRDPRTQRCVYEASAPLKSV